MVNNLGGVEYRISPELEPRNVSLPVWGWIARGWCDGGVMVV